MWSINDRGRFGSVLLNPRMLVLGEKLHLLFFFFFFGSKSGFRPLVMEE